MLIKYNNKELDLCARLMRAEALAEGDLAMLMVGNVIVNRAIASCLDFKNIRSISDVVYQKPGGFVGTNSQLFNSGGAKENIIILQQMLYGFMVPKKEKNVRELGLVKEILVDTKVIVFMLLTLECAMNYIKIKIF